MYLHKTKNENYTPPCCYFSGELEVVELRQPHAALRHICGRGCDQAGYGIQSRCHGKWYGVTLSAENKRQFLIPEGFAHGFLVLSDEAEFCYKVNDFWHPNDEGGMAWNDPEIGIEWPELKGEYKSSASAEGYTLEDGTALNLSDKDQKWQGLKDTFKF